MKFACEVGALSRHLDRFSGVIKGKKSEAILGCIELDVRPTGVVRMCATDRTVVVMSEIPAKVMEPGTRYVTGDSFISAVRALKSDDTTTLSVRDNRLHLSCKKAKASFAITSDMKAGFYSDHFDKMERYTVQSGVLASMLSATQHAASDDDTRINLCGIHVCRHRKSGAIRTVATNGHRLMIVERNIGLPERFQPFIIPNKAAEEAIKLMKNQQSVQVSISDRFFVLWLSDGGVLATSLVDGMFPDYESVMPPESKCPIEIDRRAVLSTLKRVALMHDKDGPAKLVFRENEFEIVCRNQIGEMSDTVAIQSSRNCHVGLNPIYLIEALEAFDADSVDLHVADDQPEINPIMLTEQLGISTAVIMPMRI